MSLGLGFLDYEFKGAEGAYYERFGDKAKRFEHKNAQGQTLASVVCYFKSFFQRGLGPVKVMMVSSIKTKASREALIAWSEHLMPQVLDYKEKNAADFGLMLISKRQQEHFGYFVRPRKKREKLLRFHHLRSVRVEMVQGKSFFGDDVLEHITIRTARESDLENLESFIKKRSENRPLARSLHVESVSSGLKKEKEVELKNIALAFNSQSEIVGALGAFDPNAYVTPRFHFDEVRDSIFLASQKVLRFGSLFQDLRSVGSDKLSSVRFFSHMYFNNRDIFYSLACWWLDQTKKNKSVFLYPYYKGDRLGAPPKSLVSNAFGADLYLLSNDIEDLSDLLRPSFYSPGLDVDLHHLV